MSQSRQLAAIMFTDIVGYTALMGKSEEKAFNILRQNRELQKPIVEEFNGRWIKELGDGVMASFATVSDAVNAAIRIQHSCHRANIFQLRIGIHLGEVVFENNDVFGDGVNIAARIQSTARPGSIYISESVYHNVSNKTGIQTRFITEETLKNVKNAVRIYEVVIQGSTTPAEANVPTPRRNSIAVLPFANMSSDPEQEYFSDGLTEEIIGDLSKLTQLLVISRSSIMTFKGTQKKIKDIASEVNVRYVLEGSVRKAGNNLRISAQLIDSTNDSHIWSEKYNGSLEDVFDIQEKVSRSICDALELKLSPQESKLITERPITNVQAYECYLRARQGIMTGSKESTENAFKLLQTGLDLIGPNDLLYATLGYAHFFYLRLVDKMDHSSLEKAKQYVAKAFELNPRSALAHVVVGWIYWTEGNLAASCRSMKTALSIEPNNYDAIFGLSETYIYAGKANSTWSLGARLLEMDPLMPMVHIMRGSFFLDVDIKDGLSFFEKAYAMDPGSPLTQWMLACVYFWCEKNEEAFGIVDQLELTAPEWAFTKQVLILKYGLQGDLDKALTFAIAELDAESRDDRHFAFHLAESYAVINDKKKALDLLEYSIQLFYPYRFLSTDPLFKNIATEERFHDLMELARKQSDAFDMGG